MIRLSLPKEPYWLDLPHGVRLYVRPLTTAIYEAAYAKAARRSDELVREHIEITMAGGSVEGLPDLEDKDAVQGLSQFLFVRTLAEAAIIRWENVADENGDPVEVSEKSVSELMQFHRIADVFIRDYTRTHIEAVVEGNASWPSPNGTSAVGRNTAGCAGIKDSPVPAEA